MPTSFSPRLGFDNYALRALGWKARQILDHAATLKLDAVLFSDFDVYESLADEHLRDLKRRADDLGIQLYAGMLSICPASVIFDPRRGPAETQLRLCLRIARLLGSPVARCVLGKVEDRRSPGGIGARIAETLAVLRAVRSEALDAGLKIAVENHAGDMDSTELLELIDAAGRDFVGATLDTGNALWALEEPMQALETLGPVTICTGIRDSYLWKRLRAQRFSRLPSARDGWIGRRFSAASPSCVRRHPSSSRPFPAGQFSCPCCATTSGTPIRAPLLPRLPSCYGSPAPANRARRSTRRPAPRANGQRSSCNWPNSSAARASAAVCLPVLKPALVTPRFAGSASKNRRASSACARPRPAGLRACRVWHGQG